MGWIQKTKPNLDDNFLTATDGQGHTLTDWYCWCLAVTQASFGINEAKYASAQECWNRCQDKYPDNTGGLEIPIGFYVPVFFTGGQYGHVVIAYRESYEKINIWSSPYTHKPYFDTFSGETVSTLKKIEKIYGCNYVGWTATLTGKRILQWGEDRPTLAYNSYAEPKTYKAKLQPTYCWDVSSVLNFDRGVPSVGKLNRDDEFVAYGEVFNVNLNASYLLDKDNLEKKIAHGYNVNDMVIVEKPVENSEPPEEPPVEKTDETVETNNLLIKLINRLINWLKSLLT